MPLQKVVVPDSLDEVDCWFGNVDKLHLSTRLQMNSSKI